jgi:chorismate synthase
MPIREQAEGRTERSASSKQEAKAFFLVVIPGLDPGIHAFRSKVRQKIRHSRACLPRRSFSEDPDRVRLLSGLFEGATTGTPLGFTIYNEDQRSRDYSQIREVFRPGHADFTYQAKYGVRDYRGGGRASGRETVSRVVGGAVAQEYLRTQGDHGRRIHGRAGGDPGGGQGSCRCFRPRVLRPGRERSRTLD